MKPVATQNRDYQGLVSIDTAKGHFTDFLGSFLFDKGQKLEVEESISKIDISFSKTYEPISNDFITLELIIINSLSERSRVIHMEINGYEFFSLFEELHMQLEEGFEIDNSSIKFEKEGH